MARSKAHVRLAVAFARRYEARPFCHAAAGQATHFLPPCSAMRSTIGGRLAPYGWIDSTDVPRVVLALPFIITAQCAHSLDLVRHRRAHRS